MRRASVETIEKLVQSKADQARERRVSLTIMNCIWARNTERETTLPVHGDVVCKSLFLLRMTRFVDCYTFSIKRAPRISEHPDQTTIL